MVWQRPPGERLNGGPLQRLTRFRAAALSPKRVATVTIRDGQIRWFAPGALVTGEQVRCVSPGAEVLTRVSAPPRHGELAFGEDGSASLQIDRRPNGATQVVCGSVSVAEQMHLPKAPYLIGQNGLALLRIPTLAALERVYGRPSSLRRQARRCLAGWAGIGLTARFENGSCATRGLLDAATVTGPLWSTVNGAAIGNPLAELQWLESEAKPLSTGRWLLVSRGTGAAEARLFATVAGGRVTAFSMTRG